MTTVTLTEDELAAIEAREQAATPRPWKWHHDFRWMLDRGCEEDDEDFEPLFEVATDSKDADRDFIVYARDDVPRLTVALRAANARLEAADRLAEAATVVGSEHTMCNRGCRDLRVALAGYREVSKT